MKKQILLAITYAFTAYNAEATMPVVDYSAIAQQAGEHAVDYVQWAKTELNTLQTQLNTLRTYENTVLQVARMGNPAALRNLPVIRDVAELAGDGQQLLREYQDIRALVNPQALKQNLMAVQSAYGLQQWSPLAPGAYAFPSASYAVSQTVQDQMAELEKKRQTLEQKRDSLLQSLQGATTQSDVQKYHAGLVAVNGALQEVAARANELAQKSQLQQQQLEAGRAVQRQQVTERTGAGFSAGVSSEMDQLNELAPDYTHGPRWAGQ